MSPVAMSDRSKVWIASLVILAVIYLPWQIAYHLMGVQP
jgi:hypothetical protein